LPQRREKKGPSAKDRRPIKKKTSILNTESVKWIDYKDVNLLRRFMSERAKIRARRVTGNDQQQQAAVAKAIKLAREMALLPYSVRQVTQRSKGRRDRGDRGDRGELRLPSSVPTSQSAPSQVPDDAEDMLGFVDGEGAELETPDLNGSGAVDGADLDTGGLGSGADEGADLDTGDSE
jgi:small subunit ribosomal protein S18